MLLSRSFLPKKIRRTLRLHRGTFLSLLLLIAASPSLVAVYVVSLKPTSADNNKADVSTARVLATSKRDKIIKAHNRLVPVSEQPFQCNQETGAAGQSCCVRWDSEINTDEWWLHHPTHEARDNATHACFLPVADPNRAVFLQAVHDKQWSRSVGTAATSCLQRTQISSGYAAALMAVARSFYATFKDGNTFQISRGHKNAHWNFSPFNASHWAYCATSDLNCYFLPLTDKCQPTLGQNDAPRGEKPTRGKAPTEFFWLRQYTFRQRHVLRRKLQEFMQQHDYLPTQINSSCTALHVRRGDIAFGRGRRYAAVHEYLEAGKVPLGSTIVLLTDDVSTIDEVEQYHRKDYQWVILDRPRFRGSEGGFEAFVPSEDPAYEILASLAETHLAGYCQTLVHGKSGFVALITDAMKASGRPYETVYLQTQQDKQEQPKMDPKDRAATYLDQIKEKAQVVVRS